MLEQQAVISLKLGGSTTITTTTTTSSASTMASSTAMNLSSAAAISSSSTMNSLVSGAAAVTASASAATSSYIMQMDPTGAASGLTALRSLVNEINRKIYELLHSNEVYDRLGAIEAIGKMVDRWSLL